MLPVHELVLVTGPPAAGKTTLTRSLAAAPPAARPGRAHLIQVCCRCPAAEVERRFTARAPHRHPGHVDHQLAPEIKATLGCGAGPLRLGGPVLEVDTARPVDVARVAAWVRAQRAAAP